MDARRPVEWLFDNCGPIIRYRVARDLMEPGAGADLPALFAAVVSSAETQRWLDNLGQGPFHGSKDTNAENAIAKLVAYGLGAGQPELDAKLIPMCERVHTLGQPWDAPIAAAFLIAAGYGDHQLVRDVFLKRLALLDKTAQRAEYDVYLDDVASPAVPRPWRGKPIYKPEFDPVFGDYPLPTCFDLLAMSHYPATDASTLAKLERVVAYLSDARFQALPGGYGMWPGRPQCYAGGRVFLACLNAERRLLFLQLAAPFAAARRAPWFQSELAHLETFRSEQGTYLFPPDHLKEQKDSYYLYAGAHMGLGENRRSAGWGEIESTFHMLYLKRRAGLLKAVGVKGGA